MGLRGPQATPTALRLLEGGNGSAISHRSLNKHEPVYRSGVPRHPKGLSKAAAGVWDDLVAEMEPAGVLCFVHQLPLAQLCEDQAMLNESLVALGKLRKQLVAKAKKAEQELPGGSALLSLMQSAAGRRMLNSIKDLKTHIVVQRREFGLTPASNCRVQSSGSAVDPEDAIDLALLA